MLLPILLWIIAAYWAWSVLLVIGSIGKTRKPITTATGVAAVVVIGPIIAVVVIAGFALMP